MPSKNICFALIALQLFCISDSTSIPSNHKLDSNLSPNYGKRQLFQELICHNVSNKSHISEELQSTEKLDVSSLGRSRSHVLNLTNSPWSYQWKLSRHLCSVYMFDQVRNLSQRGSSAFKKTDEVKNESEFSIDSTFFDDGKILEKEDAQENENDLNSQGINILPINCSFIEDKKVVCFGREMTKTPAFKEFRHTDILIFNSTNIQVVDLESILGLPFVNTLVFKNGILFRVAFKELISHQPDMTNLTLINNSILSLTFSSFYSKEDKNVLRVLDLRNNLITNLPQAPVTNETVLPNLEVIILSGNPLGVIPGDLFYPLRASSVKELILEDSSISDYGLPSHGGEVSPLAFLPNLEVLDLSHNPLLGIEKLEKFLSPYQNRSLKDLFLDDNSYLQVPTGALKMVNSSLEKLSMARSSIFCLDNSSFPRMPMLKTLNLQYSRISEIKEGTFEPLSALECLRLDGNSLIMIPPPLMLPALQVLTMDENPSEGVNQEPTIVISKSNWRNSGHLKVLSMEKVPLKEITNDYFRGLRGLSHLKLSGCSISYIQEGSFADLENLTALQLGRNKLQNITRSSFKGLENILMLDLSSNKLNFYDNYEEGKGSLSTVSPINDPPTSWNSKNEMKTTSKKRKAKLISSYIEINSFNDLVKLTFLNLKDNDISYLSSNIFKFFINLKQLDLSKNRIKRWDTPVFTHNTYLKYLNLRNNAIETITEAMIEDFSKPHLLVDLRDNLFQCSCSLHAFQNEMNETYFVNSDEYRCWDRKNVRNLWSYLNSTTPCPERQQINNKAKIPYKYHAMYAVLGVIAIICITVATVTYRNRWYLKYLAYKLKVRYVTHPSDSDDYEYDIFICYSQSDRQWIFEKLVDKLESAGKMRVCVHERDFLVGEEITQNILRSIKISRKVLVVISQAFVQSSWCMFELQIASNKIMDERKNKLILLLLEHVPVKEQPKEIKLLLRSRTYISWVSDIEGQKLFWKRLFNAINKSSDSEQSTLTSS